MSILAHNDDLYDKIYSRMNNRLLSMPDGVNLQTITADIMSKCGDVKDTVIANCLDMQKNRLLTISDLLKTAQEVVSITTSLMDAISDDRYILNFDNLSNSVYGDIYIRILVDRIKYICKAEITILNEANKVLEELENPNNLTNMTTFYLDRKVEGVIFTPTEKLINSYKKLIDVYIVGENHTHTLQAIGFTV